MQWAACAGNPKGVVLSHTNVLATIAALQTYVKEVGLDVHEDDSTLSYLTLAHIFGRALEEFALSLGASVGYWSVSHCAHSDAQVVGPETLHCSVSYTGLAHSIGRALDQC